MKDYGWGLEFWKGELECEAPKHVYSWAICCASYTKAKEGQRLLKHGSTAMNTKGRRTHSPDPNSLDLRAGREEEHLRQTGSKLLPLCFSGSSTPTIHLLEAITALLETFTAQRVLQKPFRAVLQCGCWGEINLSYFMLRVSNIYAGIYLFCEQPATLYPGKNLILIKTEKQFRNKKEKKLQPSILGGEEISPLSLTLSGTPGWFLFFMQ